MHSSELQALFVQVADLDAEGRERFYLANSIPESVRAELESLLLHDRAEAAEQTLGRVVAGAAADWSAGTLPETCGPYRLVRLVAQGGMGAVYLGERVDGELTLQVAVKMIHSAIAGSRSFETRFLQERQILASLSHPGIARLLDAGRTPDRGVPYLVMEFVDGVPLDAYCAGLPLDARLRILLEVCDAVAYLHRNLVVHRDLKPSNILVDSSGRAKLLDFGIAKILDEAAAEAGVTQERLLTPEYASPEQAAAGATTTATDIYSLGVILRKITAVDGVRGALADDARSIVEMCTRVEPERRYPSVDALAADLRAALESRPVRARADNRLYRANRFLRRHWIPASALVVMVLGLAAGVVYSNRERQLAEQRFSQLRALAGTVFGFDASLRNVPGTTKAREELVAASLAYLDGLERDAHLERDPALALEVANGYKLVAHAQGSPRTANLGKLGPARENLEKAARIVDLVLARDPSHQAALILGLEVASDLASIADYQDSRELGKRQVEAVRRFMGRLRSVGLPADTAHRSSILTSLATAGLACSNLQWLPEAAGFLEEAIGIAEPMPLSAVQVQLLSNMSAVRRRMGQLEESLRLVERAYAIHQRVTYPSERARMNASYSLLTRHGAVLGEDESLSLGRGADALPPLMEALRLAQEWREKDPNDAQPRDRVAKTARIVGDILRHTDPAKALATYELGIAAAREVRNISGRRDEARLLAKTALPLRRLGRSTDAAARIDAAFAVLKELGLYPPKPGQFTSEMDTAVRCLAEHQLETGRADLARKTYEQWLTWVEERRIVPENLMAAYDVSRFYLAARRAYVALGLEDEAANLDARRRQLWIEWDRKLPGNEFVGRQLN